MSTEHFAYSMSFLLLIVASIVNSFSLLNGLLLFRAYLQFSKKNIFFFNSLVLLSNCLCLILSGDNWESFFKDVLIKAMLTIMSLADLSFRSLRIPPYTFSDSFNHFY